MERKSYAVSITSSIIKGEAELCVHTNNNLVIIFGNNISKNGHHRYAIQTKVVDERQK